MQRKYPSLRLEQQSTRHAEHDLLLRMRGRNKRVYVFAVEIEVGPNGEKRYTVRNSRPCLQCTQLMVLEGVSSCAFSLCDAWMATVGWNELLATAKYSRGCCARQSLMETRWLMRSP